MNGELVMPLAQIFIYPGFLFLAVAGLTMEFVDRRLYARFQNRRGPPWFQPIADFVKLVSKEELVPENADRGMFVIVPFVALAAAVTAILYIPIGSTAAPYHFEGDLVVVLYLLTIPTLCFFLGGWSSTSLYAAVGSVRVLTQLFAYEVPLFLALLAPAVLAGSWSISDIAAYYQLHPAYALFNILGFVVALIATLGKLEKVPFDIPEAETEIVGGAFTEYSGTFLAFFRMAIDVEAIVVAALLSAVFLPFGLELGGLAAFLLFVVKLFAIIFVLALARSVLARLRIEQMVDFCWRWVAPAALVQLLISIILSGVLS